MLFINLIHDHKIKLCIRRNTIEEAANFIKEQISGEGQWKHLKGINPSECKLRIDKMTYSYYDLDGNPIKNETKIS